MNAVTNEIGWEVKESKVAVLKNGEWAEDGNHKAILRDDNLDRLSIVSKQYASVPNSYLIEIVERLAEQTGMPIEGYSQSNNGGIVLGYLRNPDGVELAGYPAKRYMVVGNSHNKTSSLFVGGSDTIIRCQNAFSRIVQNHKIRHSSNFKVKMEALLHYFKSFQEEMDRMERRFEKFHSIPIDNKIRTALIERLIDIDLGNQEALANMSTRKSNLLDSLNSSINREIDDMGANLFGLFNGVTHWTSNVKGAKEKVLGNVVGGMATINNKAYAFVDQVAENY